MQRGCSRHTLQRAARLWCVRLEVWPHCFYNKHLSWWDNWAQTTPLLRACHVLLAENGKNFVFSLNLEMWNNWLQRLVIRKSQRKDLGAQRSIPFILQVRDQSQAGVTDTQFLSCSHHSGIWNPSFPSPRRCVLHSAEKPSTLPWPHQPPRLCCWIRS